MRIRSLTENQISKFAEYRDKWLNIGLSTEKCDREKAKVAAIEAYKVAGLKAPTIFLWMNSPLEGAFAAAYLKALKNNQVSDQVWAQVRAKVSAQVRDQVRDQVSDQVWRCGYGSHDANWLAFYEFFKNEMAIHDCNKLTPLMDLASHCGWWWPFEGIVIFSEKPEEIHLQNKRLHRDGGPAIRYRDGFSVYTLNGIRVSKEIAETPANELNASLITKEKNAQVRAEIVKKIGITKVIADLGAECIDRHGDYELLLLDIGDSRKRPFLKMNNPSVDLIHIEGVEPSIRSVSDALTWRNGTEIRPVQLS